MNFIFDRPVITVEFKQPCWPGFFGGKAADSVGKLGPEFFPLQIGCVAMQEEDLGGIGEIDVPNQFSAGPNAARFNAAMPFGRINVLRGGKPRARGLQCPAGGWVDCL